MFIFSTHERIDKVKFSRNKQWKLIQPTVKFFEEKFGKRAVRLCGGAVRDLVMGRIPKDFDFATIHSPERMLELCIEFGFDCIPTGIDHGTVTVVCEKGTFEFTTLRKDVETDGRHAKVEFTKNWKADAERRDFTMNAMYMNSDSHVFDYFGGKKDIENKRVHFILDADKRIKEDYLRILRFFRFICKYGFSYDQDDLNKCIENSEGLEKVSVERIWSEFSKCPTYSFINMLYHVGAYQIGFPKKPTPTFIQSCKHYQYRNPVICFAESFETEEQIHVFCDKLKLSNVEKNDLLFFWKYKGLSTREIEKLYVKHYNKNNKLGKDRIKYTALDAISNDNIGFPRLVDITFPVDGNDLIKSGVYPGPNMGKILETLYDKWEASNYRYDKKILLDFLEIS